MHLPLLRYRKVLIVVSQAVLLTMAYCAAFLLRLDFSLTQPFWNVFIQTLPIALAVKLIVFQFFGLFRGWWRYVGVSDLLDIIKASFLSTVLLGGAVYLIRGFVGYPRSVFIIDLVLTVVVIGGMRFAVRIYTESANTQFSGAKILIVGAGRAGGLIAREIKNNINLSYNLIGFIDDDPAKVGERIHGIKVLGNTDDLPRAISKYHASQILIAIPSATGKQMQRIVDKCAECKVEFKTLPPMGDIINRSVSMDLMRRVRVEDLLKREPVNLDLEIIRRKFQGRVVLITGAGGSIGSELARQVAGFEPGKIVLFDRSENDLHRIDLEFAERFPNIKHVQAVGDILDIDRLQEIMASHRPASVFHAAAYKHVPIMEMNCFQAITNNVFGTYNVALTARQYGVEDFVLISSDKAVNPCNIMGTSKRLAEILVLALQGQSTRYLSVRFGNVLGSNGSVLPLFEQQIAGRKPITVTHPEVRRYFMTIPEAVQLVLQASAMGKGGEIFVLDMGEPIKIVDLARDLIRLSGFEPGRDIPIIFTGLRPGEKLYEELRFDGEGLKPTKHEKIRVFDAGSVNPSQVTAWMEELKTIVTEKNVRRLIAKLKEIVPEYTPSPEILRFAKIEHHPHLAASQELRVTGNMNV